MNTANITYEVRRERLRMSVLKVLYSNRGKQLRAREISNDLCDEKIYLSPSEIVSLIHQDSQLERKLTIEFKRSAGWYGLVYGLKESTAAWESSRG